jgi:hypothetical protein
MFRWKSKRAPSPLEPTIRSSLAKSRRCKNPTRVAFQAIAKPRAIAGFIGLNKEISGKDAQGFSLTINTAKM